MTIRQENKSRMYLNTIDFLLTNSVALTTLPDYAAKSSLFDTTVNQIMDTDEKQQLTKSGNTMVKNDRKTNVITLGADLSRKLVAFAINSKDMVLNKDINFSESALKKAPEVVLIDILHGLHSKATSLLSSLAAYGVTDTYLKTFLDAITNYKESISKSRETASDKREYSDGIKILFKTADDTLTQIDALIEMIRLSNPELYNAYKFRRTILDTGHRSIPLKGFVIDQSTNLPIQHAHIEIVKQETTPPEITTKKSAAKGGFVVHNLKPALYTITVSMMGYETKSTNFFVQEGKLTELTIKLPPIDPNATK